MAALPSLTNHGRGERGFHPARAGSCPTRVAAGLAAADFQPIRAGERVGALLIGLRRVREAQPSLRRDYNFQDALRTVKATLKKKKKFSLLSVTSQDLALFPLHLNSSVTTHTTGLKRGRKGDANAKGEVKVILFKWSLSRIYFLQLNNPG